MEENKYKVEFHYRIEKDAGIAVNTETRENEEAYIEVAFEVLEPFTQEQLDNGHEYFRQFVAEQLSISVDCVTPISAGEYMDIHEVKEE